MLIVISITLLFIVLRFTVTLFNFISNPKLTRVNRHYDDMVSILIPARNEESSIFRLLQSIQKQDYKYYEVIVYDDQSTDNTLKICMSFAAQNANFRIIKGDDLPHGWVGKNYACYQLAQAAKGSFMLFLDADDVIENGLINSALHRMYSNKLGLLSLFPNQLMNSIGEQVTVPLMHYLLINLLPLRLVYLVKSASVVTASGQFMLFDTEAYRKNQWHEQLNDRLAPDAEIMLRVKSAGYRAETLLANGMIKCRMYRGYSTAINGLSKHMLPAFGYNTIGLLLYILFLISGPLLIIMTLNLNMIFFMAGLIMLTRVMISLVSGQNVGNNLVFHPVQMVNLVVITFSSIQKHLTKTNEWKGRKI